MIRFVFLGSDILLFFSFLLLSFAVFKGLRKPITQRAFKKLLTYRVVQVSASILCVYFSVAVLDSIHFQYQLVKTKGTNTAHYSAKTFSVLDVLFAKRATAQEKTYSSPLAFKSFSKEMNIKGGQYYPALIGIASTIKTSTDRNTVVIQQLLCALIFASFVMLAWYYSQRFMQKMPSTFGLVFIGGSVFFILSCLLLESKLHLLGTDKVGQDVFYLAVKSIRTGLVIGLITTIVTLPFALILGLCAGYFGGKVDDAIQYFYITISSIPGVLLIAASILSMQVFISNHAHVFTSLMARADARLVSLCVILGLTGWTGLCRVLRAETLKLREMDYIQAAQSLGSSTRTILQKHVLPNVMHLIVTAVVLDFSSLVLAEAVLSYIGVGVSPLTMSWGNMINGARMELAREPLVWWPMLAAFIFMFVFVISINLVADKVRDVFDPRSV